MYNVIVTFKNGEPIKVENVKTIRTNGDAARDENDFQSFVPYNSKFYTFIGIDSILSVYGDEIKHVYFYQDQTNP